MEYRICRRCVMDTSDPDIRFDSNGFCNHCTAALQLKQMRVPVDKGKTFSRIVQEIKEKGKGKKYNCVIGVSGGVDSTYLAYVVVKKAGLTPLAIHVDNGWNTELANTNVYNAVKKLGIDLHTEVLDWEEFKSLQLAFFEASTPDMEIPTDHAIVSTLRNYAVRYDVPLILGTNYIGESILPPAWSQGYSDWAYIKKINKKFGTRRLTSFPHVSVWRRIYLDRIKRQKIISLLDYVDYQKEEAKKLLMRELDWRDYGGKHGESFYTRFFQNYILPCKFGYDKRRAHLSSLIVAGQLTREEALEELKKKPYNEDTLQEDIDYFIKKLGITLDDFNRIMHTKPRRYEDFSPLILRRIDAYEKQFFKKIIKLKNRFFKKKE